MYEKEKSDWRTQWFIRLHVAVVLAHWSYSFALLLVRMKTRKKTFLSDPTKPVVITDFFPKIGVALVTILYYMEKTLGTTPKKLKVIVGGKEANIISVKNNILYCVVPMYGY